MYPIVRKETLADNIILMDIKAPRVANECLPGQFIIAKTDEVGERIPLTICDYDREKETVTIVVQTIGAGTERMMALNEGDVLEDFVGPLGCPSELCEEENLEETRKKIIETREWTKKELQALGFTFGDSMSNFIFASHERVPATELFEALRREHIYVRHFTKERINNYLRISIGTREEMETFIRFLKEYLKEA